MSRLTAQQGMLYEDHYKVKMDMKKKAAAQSNDNPSSNMEVNRLIMKTLGANCIKVYPRGKIAKIHYTLIQLDPHPPSNT